jgi:enoyl-[acyl-carrier-protein] reductase (NADH)
MEHLRSNNLMSEVWAYRRRRQARQLVWSAESRTRPRRHMMLDEMASVAVFMASDKASGMTGTTVNLTMGSLDD